MSPPMEINERLRQAREKAGYASPSEAARAFGWNENSYKSHENGARKPKLPTARLYAKAFRVDVAWLYTGAEKQAPPLQSSVIGVPLVGVAAGGVFRDTDWTPSDDACIPAVPLPGIPPEFQYALRVEGDSVNKRIPNGMYAICLDLGHTRGGPQDGQLVHVVRERAGLVENTIKEYRRANGTVFLWPVSDHPDHQSPIDYSASEADASVWIKGVVVGRFEPL